MCFTSERGMPRVHPLITVERHTEQVAPRLTAVIIEPDAMRVSFVYCGRTSSLPRLFVPNSRDDSSERACRRRRAASLRSAAGRGPASTRAVN